MDEQTKHIIDYLSISAVVATLLNALPHIGALLSVIWLAIRIWETSTVQRLFKKEQSND